MIRTSTLKTRVIYAILVPLLSGSGKSIAEEWSVPLAGNAFRTEPDIGGQGFKRDGLVQLADTKDVVSIFSTLIDRQSWNCRWRLLHRRVQANWIYNTQVNSSK